MSILMRRAQMLLIVILCTLAMQPCWAEVRLPNIFADHMVLQRKHPNKIWGKADSGEKVTVSIGKQKHETTADGDGNWMVTLEPMKANRKGVELVISGTNEVRIADVLVGEVWICSGQSNMEWRVQNSNDADLVIAGAKFPKIRMINYPNVGRQEPVWSHEDSEWMVCSPDTVGQFSAVGYFFGKQLHQTLGNVPIGLINNAWGGSSAEAWVSREVLEETGDYEYRLKLYDNMAQEFEKLDAKGEKSAQDERRLMQLTRELGGNHRPANIYNGVLKSHLGYGIKGAIWYQGESNSGRAYQYRDLFPLMIKSWRQEWGQGDFPFYWVQLADFMAEEDQPKESAWAELREAQTMTMSKLPNTGEAVIIDVGEGKDIHPRNKLDVGRRLARWALANDYGIDVAYHSPTFKSMEVIDGKAVLSFEHVNGGWRPFDTAEGQGFAIAGEDKKFVWAQARVVGSGKARKTLEDKGVIPAGADVSADSIIVWSDEVAQPVAVRYAWANNPVCNMFDNHTLPLTPFRTDDWDGQTVDAQ